MYGLLKTPLGDPMEEILSDSFSQLGQIPFLLNFAINDFLTEFCIGIRRYARSIEQLNTCKTMRT